MQPRLDSKLTLYPRLASDSLCSPGFVTIHRPGPSPPPPVCLSQLIPGSAFQPVGGQSTQPSQWHYRVACRQQQLSHKTHEWPCKTEVIMTSPLKPPEPTPLRSYSDYGCLTHMASGRSAIMRHTEISRYLNTGHIRALLTYTHTLRHMHAHACKHTCTHAHKHIHLNRPAR